jgi:hypothetical protein
MRFYAELHVYDDVVNWETPIRIRVELPTGEKFRLRGGASGEGVVIDDLPLEGPFDMDEYGRVEIHEATEHFGLTNARLQCPPQAIVTLYNELVGVAFHLETDAYFCNCGDDLRWGSQELLLGDYWLPNFMPRIAGRLDGF